MPCKIATIVDWPFTSELKCFFCPEMVSPVPEHACLSINLKLPIHENVVRRRYHDLSSQQASY